MEINRTKSIFQSHENFKLTTNFQHSSMLKYRPYFNIDSTSKWQRFFNHRPSWVINRYSTIFQRWYYPILL